MVGNADSYRLVRSEEVGQVRVARHNQG
jgi:hypothetical protein